MSYSATITSNSMCKLDISGYDNSKRGIIVKMKRGFTAESIAKTDDRVYLEAMKASIITIVYEDHDGNYLLNFSKNISSHMFQRFSTMLVHKSRVILTSEILLIDEDSKLEKSQEDVDAYFKICNDTNDKNIDSVSLIRETQNLNYELLIWSKKWKK